MILITGATGSNGAELLKRLSAIGVPLRAMVRSTSRRPNDLSRNAELDQIFVERARMADSESM